MLVVNKSAQLATSLMISNIVDRQLKFSLRLTNSVELAKEVSPVWVGQLRRRGYRVLVRGDRRS